MCIFKWLILNKTKLQTKYALLIPNFKRQSLTGLVELVIITLPTKLFRASIFAKLQT